MQVPFFSLQAIHDTIHAALMQRVESVIEQKEFILSPVVTDFENEYARYSNTGYCIGTGNGLDALKICLKCLDIGPGHEVIVPANTYIATIFAVLDTGATPVLIEPDKSTCNITASGIESATGPKTKAIIPVHLYGQACNMAAIQ